MSHLLFLDDTPILYDVSSKNMNYLDWAFMWFEAISVIRDQFGGVVDLLMSQRGRSLWFLRGNYPLF